METLLVLVAAFALVIAVALELRRNGRLNPRDAQAPPQGPARRVVAHERQRPRLTRA